MKKLLIISLITISVFILTGCGSKNNSKSKEENNNSKGKIELGSIVYFDPVSSDKCNSTTFNLEKIKNGKSTCYKWRVISTDTSGDKINIQLDHNLIDTVAWNTDPSVSGTGNGPVTVLTSLASATSEWNRVEPLTYTYDTSSAKWNYGTLSCTNGLCKITENGATISNVKARLITAEEVVAIVKTLTDDSTIADNWSLNQSWFFFPEPTNGSENNNLSWLLENTMLKSRSISGATSNTYGTDVEGYWTLSPYDSYFAYDVVNDYTGSLYYENRQDASVVGARPVITIEKSKVAN